MYLVYFDESGNTGKDLGNEQQKIFVLCSLIVPVNQWQELERDLLKALKSWFPDSQDTLEIHAHDLHSPGRGSYFRLFPEDKRLGFRDQWLQIAVKYKLAIIYRAIVKKRFQRWVHDSFGIGISINPHVVAFPLVARVVDDYLAALPNKPLAMFISDENQDVARDVEKSIKLLRFEESKLKLSQVVEKGFFIDSRKSLVLQLCDLCTFLIRKKEEHKAGMKIREPFFTAIELIEPLVHIGNESLPEILGWLKQNEEKKERPGT
jgi:hypothetical protein